MAKTDFRTHDDFVAALSDDDRALVTAVLERIREAVPEAEQVISYQLPAFKHHGWVAYVAVAKSHVSISCPPPQAMFEHFAAELGPYKRTKSAVHFPKDKPMPLDLIARTVRYQADHNAAAAS
ncbi:iron chaperone [Desertimonas flava]|uniref:iron chaperone n=1 Tax=Desertimonas flava TaxID=2064846 RepID=UPI0013C43C09|nr:DUF1801 domain-containing protein [Desertimonas flava]